MTIICAMRDPITGKVWIGADSRTTESGNLLIPTVCRKWRIAKRGRHAVALAGWGRGCDVIRHADEEMLFGGDLTAMELSGRIRNLLLADGFSRRDGSGPVQIQAASLIVVDGRLYDCDDSFAVSEIADGQVWATGSGRGFALGAAHAMRHVADFLAPVDVIKGCVAAACAYDTACGGEPFVTSV